MEDSVAPQKKILWAFRLETNILEKAKKIAEKQDKSISEVVRNLIKEA